MTGLVSILTGFVPVFLDSRRAKREEEAAEQERATAEIEKINQAAMELLSHLSHFRHWEVDDIEASYRGPAQQAYSELRAKHYTWEHAVWPKLDAGARERVRALRQKFEGVHTPDNLKNGVSKLSEEILSLTYIATGRV